jgi:apolipoprotein N-acyltransferase
VTQPSAIVPRLVAATLLAAGVVLTVAAFPPVGAWPCALVMLAPAAAFAEGRRPRVVFAFVYVYSVAMALLIVRWLVHALAVEYGVARGSAWAFTVLLVGAYALIPSCTAALYAALRPRIGLAAAPVLFAVLWTLCEWLRGEPLVLPWILAGQPLAFVPLAIQTADLGGVWAPGFLVALVGAGVGIAGARRSAGALLWPGVALLLAGAYGGWRLAAPAAAGEALRVGVVQASVPQGERFQPGSAVSNTLRHLALTRRLLRQSRVDLVVWSETAVDDDLDTSPALEASLRELVDASGVPLVTGAPRAGGGRRRNSVFLFRPGAGPADVYDKQRLVPFSEYEPRLFAWLQPLVAPLTEGEPYVPGEEARVLRAGPAALAAPICFEITYPHLLRRFQAAGAATTPGSDARGTRRCIWPTRPSALWSFAAGSFAPPTRGSPR